MNKYQIFLAQSKYQNPILKDSRLVKVVVDDIKSIWIFHIELNDFIEADLLFTFTKTLKDYFKHQDILEIDIKYHHLNTNNFDKEALNYYDNTLYYLQELKSSFDALKQFKVTYSNNTYTIHVDNESLWVREYFNEITNVFSDLGIKPKLKLEVNEELKTINQKIKDRIETRVERLKEIEPVKREIVETKKIYSKTKASTIELSKIPVDQFGLDKYINEFGNDFFIVEGEILEIEVLEKANFKLLEMIIGDDSDAITIKSFIRKEEDLFFVKSLKPGNFVNVEGKAKFDTFSGEVTITTNKISLIEGLKKDNKKDKAKEKRVEFHVHTKMSDMDGVSEAKEYIERAIQYGHSAIAFTDHNGVYAFPDIYKAAKGKDIKIIYGAELDFVDPDKFIVISNASKEVDLIDDTYVVFDLETTGLSATNDNIIEIGAVKVKGAEVIARYQSFVNPHRELSDFIKGLTKITDEDLVNARNIDEVLTEFLEFVGDSTMVAHNASFDMKFILENSKKIGKEFKNPYIDTLHLARYFYNQEIKRFNLKSLSKYFKVELENHHRADEDAEATSKVWIKMLYELREKGIKTPADLYNSIDKNESFKHLMPSHVTVLAKNQDGYKDLFKVISYALTKNYYNGARTIKEELIGLRKNLLIGSACDSGDVFEAALNGREEDLIEAIKFYDYIEVQPPSAYKHVIDKIDFNGYEVVTGTIAKIIKYAKQQDKIVIASSNAHYVDNADELYRKINVKSKIVGGGLHPLYHAKELPKQYFRTTNEMLDEFDFLGHDLAKEIVVTNTNLLNNMIESVRAFPKELYSLPDDAFQNIGITSIEEETRKLVLDEATRLYGSNPHPIVTERIDKELKSIIGNKFAPIYYISHLLVKKSLEDGYLVGSRGSVGSSFVATLMGITEVNPLKPHYRCKKGHFTAFKLDQNEIYEYGISEQEKQVQSYFDKVQSGFDLEDLNCPICNERLVKDGHDIPFETFLGFAGDKVPDIDLNFSGDYQSKAHEYIRELLGEDYSFRAGTIGTVADKTAYGYVLGYLEENNLNVRKAQIKRMANKMVGVKRTTGQHPGGIVVVPKNKTIYDVTPIQYPANDTSSNWYTTHFDYHSFEDNLLKLDILGHDDPTLIKYLMDEVYKNPSDFPFDKATDIPLDDHNVYKMFSGTKAIGIKEEDILSEVASFGIPEFGTPFTREMLRDTKPSTFAGLVKISGLSHGTDVWLKNSKDLIAGDTKFDKVSFDDIIACRDDIMVQLSEMGLDPFKAFEIMEFVRKGKPSKDTKTWNTYVEEMEKHEVPEWYIWSASQIKYMFPKAHATAYVLMAMRIAWFKFYKPVLFYSGFFSKRASQFDYESMILGTNAIRNKLNQLEKIPMFERKVKDNDLIVTLGVALEMSLRGIKFLPVDINKSEATKFLIEGDKIRMPFISVGGLGEQVAYGIVEARNEKAFDSIKDVRERTKINKTVHDLLIEYGAYGDLKDESFHINEGFLNETHFR